VPWSFHPTCHQSCRLGQTISTRQPGPERIAIRKPCSFTIAATKFRPRPTARRVSHLVGTVKTPQHSLALLFADAAAGIRHAHDGFVSPRNNAMSTLPPSGVNLMALSTRLATASISKSRSPRTVRGCVAPTHRAIFLVFRRSARRYRRPRAASRPARQCRIPPTAGCFSISARRNSAVMMASD